MRLPIQSSEKVAYKPGLDYVLERFLTRTFIQVTSVLPEHFQKVIETWGTAGSTHVPSHSNPPPPPKDRTPMTSTGNPT